MNSRDRERNTSEKGVAGSGRVGAFLVAIALLVGSGIGYRISARELSRPSDSAPLPEGTLEKMPMEIGRWSGQDVALDDAVIKATDTDAHVNRMYLEAGGVRRVGFYLAYGVRGRDLLPHRPEVCYPGGGWTLQDKRTIDLKMDSGGVLPCQILKFTRGTLGGASIIVLNYYIVDGEFSPDVSLLRSKAWHGQSGIHYMVQVQITSTGDLLGSMDSAEEAVRQFAVESVGEILTVLPEPGETVVSK